MQRDPPVDGFDSACEQTFIVFDPFGEAAGLGSRGVLQDEALRRFARSGFRVPGCSENHYGMPGSVEKVVETVDPKLCVFRISGFPCGEVVVPCYGIAVRRRVDARRPRIQRLLSAGHRCSDEQ